MVEQLIRNEKVGGSTPLSGTNLIDFRYSLNSVDQIMSRYTTMICVPESRRQGSTPLSGTNLIDLRYSLNSVGLITVRS